MPGASCIVAQQGEWAGNVMVEPRPAVLVALGKPFQKRIGSFKHGISQQLTEECAGWYGDRLVV